MAAAPQQENQQMMIAVNPEALDRLFDEIAALRRDLESVKVTPKPEWLPLNEYAKHVHRNRKTVIRWIEIGKVEAKHIGGVRMVKV